MSKYSENVQNTERKYHKNKENTENVQGWLNIVVGICVLICSFRFLLRCLIWYCIRPATSPRRHQAEAPPRPNAVPPGQCCTRNRIRRAG